MLLQYAACCWAGLSDPHAAALPVCTLPTLPTPNKQTTQHRRKEETRFLNKMEAQRGYEAGSSLALLSEAEAAGATGARGSGDEGADPGFSQAQVHALPGIHCF